MKTISYKTRTFSWIVFMIAGMVVALSCSQPKAVVSAASAPTPPPSRLAIAQATILGRWQMINGTQFYSFYRDGTMDLVFNNAFGTAITNPGTYQLIDESHIRTQTRDAFNFATAATYELKFGTGTATFVDAQGRAVQYQKAQ